MLRELAAEIGAAAPAVKIVDAAPAAIGAAGTCRENPVDVAFVSRYRLNKEGSAKDTWHVEFDLAASGLTYEAGDSFGLFPANELGLVDQIIAMLGASHVTPLRGRTLREVLCDEVALGAALWQWLAQGAHFYVCGDAKRMAKDVEAALVDIVATHGARPTDEAVAFVSALKKAGRYQADVY